MRKVNATPGRISLLCTASLLSTLSMGGCSVGDAMGGSFTLPELEGDNFSGEAKETSQEAQGPAGQSSQEPNADGAHEPKGAPSTSDLPDNTTSAGTAPDKSSSNHEPAPGGGSPARCDDGEKNGQESDIDCGGPQCSPCADHKSCTQARDCSSAVCSENRCAKAGCEDGVLNSGESDVDCGGLECARCPGGSRCQLGRDCRSGSCDEGLCSKEACSEDSDCKHLDGQCSRGSCDPNRFHCVQIAANEGQACDSKTPCVDNERCEAGQCGQGSPKDCSHLQDSCTKAYCDESSDSCQRTSLVRWTENFSQFSSNNHRGWRSDYPEGLSNWRFGKAKRSLSCFTGQDPAKDHSADDTEHLIGTVIGGCIETRLSDWDCVYGPSIDLRDAPDDITLSFWRYLQTQDEPTVRHKILGRKADGSWEELQRGFATPIWDSKWEEMTFSVAALRHEKFAVGICMTNLTTSPTWRRIAGWSIDDFVLAPKNCKLRL